MIWVTIILLVIAVYLLAGLLFAAGFLIRGLAITDESAKDTGWGFRLIILPGILVWWPLLLKKWVKKKKLLAAQKQ